MTQDVSVAVTRRQAAVSAALAGAAVVVLGYASGWGLSLPVPGSVTAAQAPAVVAAPSVVPPPALAVPVAAHHYYAVGPAVVVPPTAPPTPTAAPSGGPTTAPSTPPSPGSPSPSGSGGGHSCTGLRPALQALIEHVDAGHLDESLSQQVTDLLDVGQYATTHTTLLAHLLQPLVGAGVTDLDVLLQHIEAGHLEESPAQQVQDLLDTDRYVKTHTVLIEHLLQPLVGDTGC